MIDSTSTQSDDDGYLSLSTYPHIKYRPMPDPLSVYVPIDCLTSETIDSVILTALQHNVPDWNNSRRTLLAFLLSINEKVSEIENNADSNTKFNEQIVQHAAKVRQWLVKKDEQGNTKEIDWTELREKYNEMRKESGDKMATRFGLKEFQPYYELTLKEVHPDIIRSRDYMTRFRNNGWKPHELKIYWDEKQIESLCPKYHEDVKQVEKENKFTIETNRVPNQTVETKRKEKTNQELDDETQREMIPQKQKEIMDDRKFGASKDLKNDHEVDTNTENQEKTHGDLKLEPNQNLMNKSEKDEKSEEQQVENDNNKLKTSQEIEGELKVEPKSDGQNEINHETKSMASQEINDETQLQAKGCDQNKVTFDMKFDQCQEETNNREVERKPEEQDKAKHSAQFETGQEAKNHTTFEKNQDEKGGANSKGESISNDENLPPHDPSDIDVVHALREYPVQQRNNEGRISYIHNGIERAVFDVPEDAQIIVLNFANERSPGGGYLRHAWAQEEIILFNSDGYRALLDLKYGRMGGGYAIPEFGLAYVRNIRFFERGTDKVRKADMLVSACYCLSDSPQLYDNPTTNEQRIKNYTAKFRAFIAAAVANTIGNGSNTYLLLGPIGTGAFGNDVDEIGFVFREVLRSNMMGSNVPITKAFENIWFVSTDKWKNDRFEEILGNDNTDKV